MLEPFFSVVIPAYNRAHILPRTISSVQNQSFTNWELIIIDDGSTDQTAKLMQSFSNEKIHYYYQNNSERSAARNHGVCRSKGKYVCFLDSDDEFLPFHLQKLFDLISKENEPVGLFYTDCYVVYEDGTSKLEQQERNADEPWHLFFLRNSIIPARVCVHRKIFESVKFREDIVIVEDTVLWTSIAISFPVYYLKQATINYHWHDDNSVNIAKNCFLPRLKGLQKMFQDKEVSQHIPLPMKRNLLSGCYYGIARHYELMRNFKKMTFHALLSILYYPKSPQSRAKLYMIYNYFKKDKP